MYFIEFSLVKNEKTDIFTHKKVNAQCTSTFYCGENENEDEKKY